MLCDILKELRQEKNLTQGELANELGVTQSAYSNWENGIREPNIKTILKIASYFKVSTDYLLGRYKEQDPPTD